MSDNSKVKLKDKKVSIYRYKEDAVDPDGFPVEGYEKIHSGKLWAHYRQTSANEFFRAMTNQYTEDAIFVLNWRSDLDPRTDVILYNHRIYDINRVDDYEGYKQDIRISAKFNKKQGIINFPGIVDE